jgi:hypothetical protein
VNHLRKAVAKHPHKAVANHLRVPAGGGLASSARASREVLYEVHSAAPHPRSPAPLTARNLHPRNPQPLTAP